MFIDYGEICIGPPQEVIQRLTERIGQLNYSSHNIGVGLTANPCQCLASLRQTQPWQVMKLLWITHSFVLAREMEDLLRAWDGKLFVGADLPPAWEGPRRGGSYYAFVLTR